MKQKLENITNSENKCQKVNLTFSRTQNELSKAVIESCSPKKMFFQQSPIKHKKLLNGAQV